MPGNRNGKYRARRENKPVLKEGRGGQGGESAECSGRWAEMERWTKARSGAVWGLRSDFLVQQALEEHSRQGKAVSAPLPEPGSGAPSAPAGS